MFSRESIYNEDLLPQNCNVKSACFKYRVYCRWATGITFDYIDAHPEWDTMSAIERFIRLMDKYCEEAPTNNSRWIFAIARDQAEYILDCYIAEEIANTKFEEEVKCHQLKQVNGTMVCY